VHEPLALVFVDEIAPLEFRLAVPVDIMRAAYWTFVCMLDQVLNTALVAMKPKISNINGTDASTNSTATAPLRQLPRPRRRPPARRCAARLRRAGPGEAPGDDPDIASVPPVWVGC